MAVVQEIATTTAGVNTVNLEKELRAIALSVQHTVEGYMQVLYRKCHCAPATFVSLCVASQVMLPAVCPCLQNLGDTLQAGIQQ